MIAIAAITTPPPSGVRLLHPDTKPGDFVVLTNRKMHPQLLSVRAVTPQRTIITEDGREWHRVNGYERGASIWADARIEPCTPERAQEIRTECAVRQQALYLNSVDWRRLPLATLEKLSVEVAEVLGKEGV